MSTTTYRAILRELNKVVVSIMHIGVLPSPTYTLLTGSAITGDAEQADIG